MDLSQLSLSDFESIYNMTKDMRERALAELNFNREEGALEADKQKRIERVRMYCHAFQKIEEELDKRVKGIAG